MIEQRRCGTPVGRLCATVFGALLASLLFLCTPIFAIELQLEAGKKHVLSASDFDCVADGDTDPDLLVASIFQSCSTTGGMGIGYITIGTNPLGTLKKIDDPMFSMVEFVAKFQVPEIPDVANQSFVPIHVKVPVDWSGLLLNSTILEAFGSVDLNIGLDLINEAGQSVEYTSIVGATHSGIAGCLTIPTGAVSGATMAAKCALLVANQMSGKGDYSLSAVVEVGRTYSIVLRVRGDIRKKVTTARKQLQVSSALFDGDIFGGELAPPSLRWRAMTVRVGTDPAVLAADLQEQIDELREDLERHTHIFLTGRGAGHNNTEAVTSSALIPQGEPADDMDGVASTDDLCPGTPEGVEVDVSGCEIAAFCALQQRLSTCNRGDWLDDELNNPRDCRWRRGSCEAR